MNEADTDPGIRAVVLTGAGDRAFCAGMDLRAFAGGAAPTDDDPQATEGFFRLIRGDVRVLEEGQTAGSRTASKLDEPLSGTFGWRHTSTGNEAVTSEQNSHRRRVSSSEMPSSWTLLR